MKACLVPLSLRFDEAQIIHRQALLERPDEFVHYRSGTSISRNLDKPENEDYCQEDRLVCSDVNTGRIVGLLSAFWNRECNIVTGITAIRWATDGTMVFADGLRKFMRSLQSRACWVRWSASERLPQLESYKRLAKQLGGGQVGRFEGTFIGPEGYPVAMIHFQVPGLVNFRQGRS